MLKKETICSKTRTWACGLQRGECDGFHSVFIVANKGKSIIIQDHSIDETGDALSAMFQFIGIQFSELQEKECNLSMGLPPHFLISIAFLSRNHHYSFVTLMLLPNSKAARNTYPCRSQSFDYSATPAMLLRHNGCSAICHRIQNQTRLLACKPQSCHRYYPYPLRFSWHQV